MLSANILERLQPLVSASLASRTFTSNLVFNLGFFVVPKKLAVSFSFTLVLFKAKSCKCFSPISSDFNMHLTNTSSSKTPDFMFLAISELNGSSISPSFVTSVSFSCFHVSCGHLLLFLYVLKK